ncbi:MAG: tetratricopeptide repeat protein, partial [Spirochaetes bacterium]|nr:tetratricopeptide repeat protein [Spirochaetota bacterium]
VGTYRDNEVGEKHSLTRIKKEAKEQNKYALEDILLTKFDHNRLNKMIAGILGEKEEYANKLTDYVLKKSGGNPFFAITILRELVEQKTLTWKDGFWQEDWEKINKIKILGNIVDMVLLRIKDVPDNIDRLLRIGATIGKEFKMEMLYELINEEKETIVNWVDEAINKQLIEQSIIEKGKMLFIHDRIRDAFYKKMPEEEKKKNHLKIGNVIEQRNKGKEDEGEIHESPVLFDLVYHYIEGGDKDKALEYILPAAEKAKENYANNDAIKYYKIGIELLEVKGKKDSKEYIKYKEDLAEVYLTIGRNDDVISICEDMLPLKKLALEKAKIFRKIGIAWFKKGNWNQCEDNLAKGLLLLNKKMPRAKRELLFYLIKELFIHISHNLFLKIYNRKKEKLVRDKDKEIFLFYASLGWMFILSDVGKFIWSTLKMLNFSESRIGQSKQLGQALSYYASVCMSIPLFTRAIKYHEKSLILRKKQGDNWGVGQSLQVLGYCYSWKGDYQKSIEIFEQSKKIFEKIGDMWELGMALNGLGQVYQKISEYKKSLSISNRYLNISLKTNDDLGIVASQNIIGHCYIETGDFKDAENILKKALKLGEEKNIYLDNCDTNIYLGRLEIERANYNESIKYLKKAKKIDTENDLLKEYSVRLYFYLCEAYIGDFKLKKANYKSNKSKKILKKIKKACKNALKATKQWVNHYGASLRVTAKYYVLIKKKRKAEKYFLQSIKQIKSLDRRFELAKGYYEYGIFLKSINKEEESRVQWHQALDIFKQIGAKVYIKRCVDLLGYKEEDVTIETTSQERLSSDRRMTTVLNTGRYLSSILDLEELLEKIMDRTIELVGAERGALLLYPDKDEKKEHNLEIKIFRDAKKITDTDMFRMSSTIQKRMEDDAKPVIIADVQDDAVLKKSDSVTRAGIKSVLSAPIMVKNEMIGNIYLDNRL